MPELEDAKKVLEGINRLHGEMKDADEKRNAEIKTHGEALGDTNVKIEAMQNDMTEMRTAYEEACTKMNRTNAPDNAKVEEDESRAAFAKFVKSGFGSLNDEERRSLSEKSDTAGAFLVPTAVEAEIGMKKFDMAGMRDICDTSSTTRGFFMKPTLSQPTVAWGQIDTAAVTQALTAGASEKQINELVALILIHNHELEDVPSDLMGRISEAIGKGQLVAEDIAFLLGTGGASMPQGILTNAKVLARYAFTGASATLGTTLDPIEQALAKITNYRSNATIMFNSTTESTYRLMKDSEARYLWNPDVKTGAPIQLHGRPTKINEGMPSAGTDTFPVLVGDFKEYMIRDRRGMTVQRLDERYAEYRQTGLLVTKRTSGILKQEEAFAVVKCATS